MFLSEYLGTDYSVFSPPDEQDLKRRKEVKGGKCSFSIFKSLNTLILCHIFFVHGIIKYRFERFETQ